ncbi:MAG TPA: GNAT family N-acetyltransferase [Mycobacteriales bacterium]|nr:GNAT family N-acetyltransferase [Mycobacteriales bacterium]
MQREQEGFALVEARRGAQLVGLAFGVTLRPTTLWWQNLLTTLSTEITQEHNKRTFALVELLVHRPWRRQHIGKAIHDRLLRDRGEERATLTVLPAAVAAQAAYHK